MRTIEQQAHLATIADPRLRQEVSDFFSQCYIPARSKYQSERPDTPAISGILTTYGPDDPDWMGSHVYRDTAGYYDTLRPANQITGWAYNAARDTEYDPIAPPAWGKRFCKQWWEDAAIGLREKLISEADATSAGFSGLVVAIAPALAGEQQNDAVAKTVLTNAPPVFFKMVPRRGLEPPRPCEHQHLKLACLPISPPGQGEISDNPEGAQTKAIACRCQWWRGFSATRVPVSASGRAVRHLLA